MTNYPDAGRYDDIIPDGDAAATRLASDLGELYVIPTPDLRFTPPTEVTRGGLIGRLRWWQPAAAAAAATAALAAVLFAPSLWDGQSQVSAETIFARASAVAQSSAPSTTTQSYHLIAITESPGQVGVTTTETWYGDASQMRTEQDWDAANGQADFGMALNGDDAWLYAMVGGTLRVAHGPASELGLAQTFGWKTQGSSLAEVLAQYTGGCQKASLKGEETVAGRQAYKIVVSPDLSTCPEYAPREEADIKLKLGVLTVWVDEQTFLPLKTQQQDGTGQVAYTYTVTQIEVGGEILDSTFAYEAPAGAVVQDVANITEAKFVLSGYNPDGTPMQ